MKFNQRAAMVVLLLAGLGSCTGVGATASSSTSTAEKYNSVPLSAAKSCFYQLPITGTRHIINLNQVLQMTIEKESDRYRLRIWIPVRDTYDMPSIVSPKEEQLHSIMSQIVQAAAACH